MADPQKTADPWQEAADEFKASGQKPAPAVAPDEDWKIWQAQGAQPNELPTFTAIRHGMENAAEAANPMGLIRNVGSAVLHPIDTTRQIINTSREQGRRAGQEFGQGNLSSGVAHSLAAVPVLGSGLVKPLHQMEEENDPASGIGTLIGTAATAGLAPMLSGKVGRFAEGASEPLAEAALRIPSKAKTFGATPGRALIRETSGFKPQDIAASAGQRVTDLTTDLENRAANSPNPFDLTPARNRVLNAQATAQTQNTPVIHRQLIPLKRSLETDFSTKQPIPPLVSAPTGLELRRGFGKEHAEFNPNVSNEVNNVAKSTYHDLTDALHTAVPGSAPIDQTIQSLIPVKKAAERMELEPTPTQRFLMRVANPTARIAGPIVGHMLGGAPGAAAGFVLPELMTNPTSQIRFARGLNLVGRGLQTPLARGAAGTAPLVRLPDTE